MRIAFFVDTFPALTETFILRQVTGLLDLGHEVDIYSDREPERGPVVHESAICHGLSRRTVVVHKRSGVLRRTRDLSVCARLLLKQPRALRLLNIERAAPFGGRRSLLPRLRVLAASRPYDIVHCHFGHIALRYRFAASYWHAPLFVSFYGHDCSRYPQLHGKDVFAPLFQVAHRVTVLGDRMHQRLQELGCPADLLEIHRIGVNVEDFPLRLQEDRPPDDKFRLLTVARLVEKKGISYALLAVAEVVDLVTDDGDQPLVYEIIGDGPLRSELEALVDQLGLGGVVRFRGFASEAEVRKAMGRADLFVLPSVTAADGDEEGTPTVLMEAAASGLPVLSTQHSGIPEVVLDGDTGLLVAERSSRELADALQRLLAEPELCVAMGRAGRERIRRQYDSRTQNARLEQMYRNALK